MAGKAVEEPITIIDFPPDYSLYGVQQFHLASIIKTVKVFSQPCPAFDLFVLCFFGLILVCEVRQNGETAPLAFLCFS
jgi:hypothetical protein